MTDAELLDTSVAIKTVIKEADSAKAIQLRDDYNNAIHDLLAPDIFPTEICNVLMMAERRGTQLDLTKRENTKRENRTQPIVFGTALAAGPRSRPEITIVARQPVGRQRG
jgi:hypothetical protein